MVTKVLERRMNNLIMLCYNACGDGRWLRVDSARLTISPHPHPTHTCVYAQDVGMAYLSQA